MARVTTIEQAIRDAGAIKIGEEFTAHNGEVGNCKVVMDDILGEASEYPELRGQIADRLAYKLEPYEPEVIIPIPEGANMLGLMVANRLGVRAVYLAWEDKEAGKLRYRHQHDRIVVCRAEKVALVDDVRRKTSSMYEVIKHAELEEKVVVGGVAWDRAGPAHRKSAGLQVVSVVKRYLPLRVKV